MATIDSNDGHRLAVIDQGDTVKFRRREVELMGSGQYIIIDKASVVDLGDEKHA